MKKLFYSFIALAMAAMTITSCEDVPAPYDLPDEGGGNGGTETVEPTGSGTLEDPFNAAAAIEYCSKLESGAKSTTDFYIKGKVVSINQQYNDTNYGTATFYISEDGTSTKQFYVYRALYLGNKKYTSGDLLQEGDEVIVCGKITNYSGTYETVASEAYLYSLNGNTGGSSTPTGEAKGDGSLQNPYNPVGAAAAVANLTWTDKDTYDTTGEVYVKGKISHIANNGTFTDGGTYGNASFYISEDGTESGEFYCFRVLYLGNKKFESGKTDIKVGDEVVVCGQLMNYQNNTPETVAGKAYVYSLNGQTEGGSGGGGGGEAGTPSGDGTLANPYNAAAASAAVANLTWTDKDNYDTTGDVYVKGKISRIADKGTFTDGGTYGNASFYISDDGTQNGEFYCFRVLYLGNAKYESGKTDIKVGDEVVIFGKLMNYRNDTPETVAGKAYLYSLNGKTEGGSSEGGGGSGDTSTYPTSGNNGNFETWSNNAPANWATESSAGNAKLEMTQVAHGGSAAVVVKGASSNQRLGYKELSLKAGDYVLTFYTKAATSDGGSVRPGYVKVTDGKVGNYMYGDYVNNLSPNEWTTVSHKFTLDEDGVYCIVIMNSKTPGKDVIIDDVVLKRDNTTIIE